MFKKIYFILLLSFLLFCKQDAKAMEDITSQCSFEYKQSKISIDVLYDQKYDVAWTTDKELIIATAPDKKVSGMFVAFSEISNIQIQEFRDGSWHLVNMHSDFLNQYIDLHNAEKVKIIALKPKRNAIKITELTLFSGQVENKIQNWQPANKSDVLIVVNKFSDVSEELKQLISNLTNSNKSVVLLNLSAMQDKNDGEQLEQLWNLGLTKYPYLANFRDIHPHHAQEVISKWGKGNIRNAVTNAVRNTKPKVILYYSSELNIAIDEVVKEIVREAFLRTNDPYFCTDVAGKYGIWQADKLYFKKDIETNSLLQFIGGIAFELVESNVGEDTVANNIFQNTDNNVIETNTKPKSFEIPNLPTLNSKGFIEKGEFVYKNSELGIWQYISSSLNVHIEKNVDEAYPLVWYTAEIKSDIEKEEVFKAVPFLNKQGKKENVNPVLTAQLNQVVFGINADYYSYRQGSDRYKGIDIRNGTEIIYDDAYPEQTFRHPNLDIMALFTDGNVEVYDGYNVKAQQFIDQGAYDVFSFGPYLIKNGEINPNIYNVRIWDMLNPRIAFGMVKPGHYVAIMCEGRLKDSKGVDLDKLAKLMLDKKCQVAFNLDGGQTAVMLFMGEQLNRIATYGDGKILPRFTREILGIGRSAQTEKNLVEKLNKK